MTPASSAPPSFLPAEAESYHARFGIPWVTLTYAQSLDGSLALRKGEPSPISCAESMQVTHQLRATHDAILVGIETVLSDDPRLTVRLVDGADPQPIVLDSRLRYPMDAKLNQHPKGVWLATTKAASVADQNRYSAAQIKILKIDPEQNGLICLRHLLIVLGKLGIRSLMVEGGGQVITSFLRHKLANRVVLTLSPIFAGGYAAVDSLGIGQWQNLPRLCNAEMRPIGQDFLIWGILDR